MKKKERTAREQILEFALIGKVTEINQDWFIAHTGLGDALLHICKKRFWEEAVSIGLEERDIIVEMICYLGKGDKKCQCKKPVPKIVRAFFHLATMRP